jgi:putative ABC transport system permease protein
MSFLIWLREHAAEGILVVLLGFMSIFVFLGFLLPPSLKIYVVTIASIFLILIGLILFLIGRANKLQVRLGFRNLVRHKSDTVIAILGFMIGTSIICASLAIGDTMGNMIQSLVYEEYYLVDEYVQLVDENGDNYFFDGQMANNISDRIWSINDEGRNLIDGVSWEVISSAAIIDLETELFEPSVNIRAFSNATDDSFGKIYSHGKEVKYDLDDDQIFITDELADLIDGDVGHTIHVTTKYQERNFIVKEILDSTGRLVFRNTGILMNFDAIWNLYNLTEANASNPGAERDWSGGYYNILFISNTGGKVAGGKLAPKAVDAINEKLKGVQNPVDPNKPIEVTDDKKTSIDSATTAISMFTTLFLALGTFSIIAGITLILNIFVMLAEERKEEMGISRAVGMKRRHLRVTYLFEGLAYSLISSVVGVILGVVTGYLIILGVQGIIKSFGGPSISILDYYTVSPMSLILAFIGGFSITIGTTLLITQMIANLNIVSAIRNTPVPKTKSKLIIFMWKSFNVWDNRNMTGDSSPLAKFINFVFDRLVITGILMISFGAIFMMIGFFFQVFWGIYLGSSMILIGLGLIIRFFVNARLTYNITAVLILALWVVPTPSFMSGYYGDLEMFILSGIFMVSAGVLLLVWNSDILIWIVDRTATAVRFSPASIKMAIAYPMKKKFRTGVTIFMFALIIFTITGMSMITEIFNVNIAEFERSVGGGYDIIGFSLIREIEDLRSELEGTDVQDAIDWERTVSLNQGILQVNVSLPYGMGYQEMQMSCSGVSDKFIKYNQYGFVDVAWDVIDPNETMERTDENAWNALKLSHDYVILDSTLGSGGTFSSGIAGFSAGDEITLLGINGTIYNKTVIGVSELFGYNSVFQYESYAAKEFNAVHKNLHLISVNKGENVREVANEMRKDLIGFGFYAVVVREIIEQFLRIQNAFFDLFNAFLSLGLIIGIVGLGIVTLRSVYERRHEIGMMRAVGFKRRAVVGAFIGESGFIAGSGLIVGTILGIILGWILWRDGLKDTLPEFGVPWLRLTIIVGAALTVAIIASVPPSYRASKITPAEALRYE